MTNYNDGKWHGWNGGECPVHPKSEVEAVWHDPNFGSVGIRKGLAHGGAWYNQILKFRVIKEYKEPREFWAKQFSSYAIGLGKPMEKLADTWTECGPDDDGATLFREVQS